MSVVRCLGRLLRHSVFLAWVLAPAMAAAAEPALVAALQQAIENLPPGASAARDQLRGIYARLDYAPLWRDGAALDALRAALVTAPEHGIDPRSLHVEALSAPNDDALPALAAREVMLTDAYLRWAEALRRGAVPAAALGPLWTIAPDASTVADELVTAAASGTLVALVRSLPPPDRRYAQLLEASRRYRAIAAAGGWPLVAPGEELLLEGNDSRLAALRRRLQIEGDLPPGPESPNALRAALRRFQARHGLATDGRVGQRTLTELGQPVERRIAQIAVNLERWRHLPRGLPATHIAVNIAAQILELVEQGATVMEARTVVGDRKHPTPSIAAWVVAATLNPPWNVPASIANKEILPRLKRDPHYLEANRIAIVNGDPEDPFGTRVRWRAIRGAAFPYPLRQQPGPKNSLGAIKLEMPNRLDIYLHDTPSKSLFGRAQRGFSHGCIRVQGIDGLLLRLLRGAGEWDAASLAAAVATGESRRIPLPAAVRVYLLYLTAFVAADGVVNFREDIYDEDAPVAAALGGGILAVSPASAGSGPAN